MSLKFRGFVAVVLLVAFVASASAQFTTKNPLDELKDQVAKVLSDARVPFSAEQQQQLALFIEEQRQASEDLFGVIMDFSKGPPEGDARDRALAGIQWMHDQFKKKLPDFLTPAQRAAWERSENGGTAIGARIEGAGVGGASTNRVQQIRIVNNAFNAETATSGVRGPSGGGERTEIIQRGGAGAFHGNMLAAFQDDALNARNPFATNKPPYHQRTINGNFSGPLIQDRLTLTTNIIDTRQENVGTVKAELLEGPFALGITRPNITRSYEGRGIWQVADAHSVYFGYKFGLTSLKNQGSGDFVLSERGWNSNGQTHDFDVRQISILSDKSVHEFRFAYRKSHNETKPLSETVGITVLDAFSGGGSQNGSDLKGRIWEAGNLYYFAGNKVTFRAGLNGWFRQETSINEANRIGEFIFSCLRATCPFSYETRRPLQYHVTRGNPLVEFHQVQVATFVQADVKVNNRLTTFLGLRFEDQNNISDHNNFDPRLGFAYAIGKSTVIRGGAGTFHDHVDENQIRTLQRLDGKRQQEIQVDEAGWPDPFVTGNVRVIPPSLRRVLSDHFVDAYYASVAATLEQSLPNNLFITVGSDFNQGLHLARSRNLNAPLPGTGLRPFPSEGQIYQLQSTGRGTHKNFKVTMRQRFSIFNLNASYTFSSSVNDSPKGGATGTQGQGFEVQSDSYNSLADWGPSGVTQKHNFTSSVNSRLPMDVYLTTAITARSGSFYDITTGKDDNRDGVVNDRPVGVIKNGGVGPHFFNVSLNFSKAFQLRRVEAPAGARQANNRNPDSGPQLNAFANLNNAFNMTHPGTPSGVVTSPFFGKPVNAVSPREIEIGMRFQF